MNPDSRDVYVDEVLTNVSLATIQEENDFVARRVFPVVPVQKQSSVYYEWSKADMLRSEMAVRPGATESAAADFRLEASNPYNCKVRALHSDLDDQTRANGGPDVESTITEGLTQKALIHQELEWASKYFKTGVWGTDATPGALWSAANSNPITDIRSLIRAVQRKSGQRVNTLVFGGAAWDAFLDAEAVVDRFKHTMAGGQTTEQAVGGMFKGARVLVGDAINNVDNEKVDQSDPTLESILGNHVLACYSAPAPSLMRQSAGYTFAWQGLLGANAQATAVSSMRMPLKKADRLEIEAAYDQKLVSASCGGILTSVI